LSSLYYYQSSQDLGGVSQLIQADLCIYGGTSAGVVAAIQAKQMGLNVVLVEFSGHLGGMTAGGLGATDIGNKQAIGGLSRQFYRDVAKHYGVSDEQGGWTFEPHVAEEIYKEWIRKAEIPVYFYQHLKTVYKSGQRITQIEMENGTTFAASMFIDASYEGDLLARAGVSYHVGRESNATYHETLNGIHFGDRNHNFKAWIDPYVVEGKPDSGLLPGVTEQSLGYQGMGDSCVQAYNFRICLTNVPEKRMPFPQPPKYDPESYTLLARYLRAGVWDAMRLHIMMPNGKTDLNNFGAVSTDHIGRNYEWPNGSYEVRERIFQDHVNYNMGLLYFLSHDERVPLEVRKEVNQWGLPNDEFLETGGWPHQLYIREARRMIGEVVMTEHLCRGYKKVDDPVGLAAYTMDSHNCRRVIIDGRCINEGNVEVPPSSPYPISYRAIIPLGTECTNILVPVCLSSSHIAYGSIRMEPVFMVLGQSAATAAALALDKDCSVQELPYEELRKQLLRDAQVLEWKK
jgi:hypothetical protein